MPRQALILGAEPEAVKRIKAALQKHLDAPDWIVTALGTPKGVDTAGAMRLLDRTDANGVHVLCFRPRGSEAQSRVKAMFQPGFRFRWLESAQLANIWAAQPEFAKWLRALLDEEVFWANRIQPKAVASALLLPECSFSPRVRGDVWEIVANARSFDDVAGAERVVTEFEDYHWQATQDNDPRSSWVDARKLVFRPASPRAYHGKAPFPRSWKYSFRVPDGFHYDITHVDERGFQVTERGGDVHRGNPGGHVNLDPHGVSPG